MSRVRTVLVRAAGAAAGLAVAGTAIGVARRHMTDEGFRELGRHAIDEHVPHANGERLAKRAGSPTLASMRAEGIDPKSLTDQLRAQLPPPW